MAVAEGRLVAVRVGGLVGVLVRVRVGQSVSVGGVVGPVGVLVNVSVGVAVRVGGTGVAVKGIVSVIKIAMMAVGVGLTNVAAGLTLWLRRSWIPQIIPIIPRIMITPLIDRKIMKRF